MSLKKEVGLLQLASVKIVKLNFTQLYTHILISLVPRPSLSLSFAVTILEAGKKEGKKEFFLSCLQNCYCKREKACMHGNKATYIWLEGFWIISCWRSKQHPQGLWLI